MNLLVIGAGPAGLTSAIFAAKGGATVTIIEHTNKIGQKLSITGNGKCNISNVQMDSSFYYGDISFIDSILSAYNVKDTIDYFNDMGIYTIENKGYIYPMNEQAKFVSNRMREYAINLGIKIKTNNEIISIAKSNHKFVVDFGIKSEFDKVVIATGGKSFSNTGSDGSGYDLAKCFGHTIVKPKPALTALVCKRNELFKAAGVRVNAKIMLDDTYIQTGQLQITDYGISGIPVFNLSSKTDKGSIINIDFAPNYSKESLSNIIKQIIINNKSLNILQALQGLFNTTLAEIFVKVSDINNSNEINIIIEKLINTIKCYELVVEDRKGFDFAQVTSGGVSTDEINPETMESNIVPGLYFAGEIIDVDGWCGGYNLQFAFSTGAIAGRNLI